MRKTESLIEHYSRSNTKMHDELVKQFMIAGKKNDVDMMIKITGSVGYMQQVQTSLTKNLYIEKHIKDINRKLDRIPPEMLQQINNPINPSLLENNPLV